MLRLCFGISLITVALIAIRFFCNGRISKRIQYALWLIIPIYMIVAPFASWKITVPVVEDTITQEKVIVTTDVEPAPLSGTSNESIEDDAPAGLRIDWNAAFKNTYLFVTFLLLVVFAAYNAGFALYCRKHREFIEVDSMSKLKVYRFNHLGAPFLLWNKIYLNDYALESDASYYVIRHEYCHYKHGDTLWAAVRFVVLAFNWYNPLIWYAFLLCEQDCELACDESVLTMIGEHKNIEYGKVLLNLLAEKQLGKRDFSLTTAMNGRSKKFMRKRIINIKQVGSYKFLTICIVMALLVGVVGCSLIEVKEETKKPDESEKIEEVQVTDTETESVLNVEQTTGTEEIDETSDAVIEPETVIYGQPPLGNIDDGYYTVDLTAVTIDDEYGNPTCMFYPWMQVEYSADEVEELQIGQTIDLANSDSFIQNFEIEMKERQIVNPFDPYNPGPYTLYGTEYTGNLIQLANKPENFYLAEVKDSGTWKLFSSSDTPVSYYSDVMRIHLASDYQIFDSVSPYFNQEEFLDDMSIEQRADFMQFYDTTYSGGYIDSIRDFYRFGDDNPLASYSYTVIRVEENQVTEIYFWYHP